MHGEADLLPSLIVDRYGEYLVVQALSQGTDRLLPVVVALAGGSRSPARHSRAQRSTPRLLEGLEQRVEVLYGDVPDIAVVEGGSQLRRRSPARAEDGAVSRSARESRGRGTYARGRLLDCFSYNGGFALSLGAPMRRRGHRHLRGRGRALPANAARNGVTVDVRVGNVFDELRGLERLGERFDTIVLDPPAFAKNKAAVAKATAGLQGDQSPRAQAAVPGGTLVTCSCSYHVNEAAFAEIVYDAAVDARVHVTVVEKRMQARDHPVLLGVPETYYLKCFILRKLA